MSARHAAVLAMAALLAAACTAEPTAHAGWRLGIAPARFQLPGAPRSAAPVAALAAQPDPTPTPTPSATPTPLPDGNGGSGGNGGAAPATSGGGRRGGGGSGGGGSSGGTGSATPTPEPTPTATPTRGPARVLENSLDPGVGALAGVVRDVVRAGAPLGEAIVTVVDAADPAKRAEVTTGPDGRWALADVALRRYTVVARRPGAVADVRPIEALLYPGAPALTSVNFALSPP